MIEEEFPVVIIDHGSGFIKAGFSSDKFPLISFPTIIGKRQLTLFSDTKEWYIGDEAVRIQKHLTITRPIRNGIIQSFDSLERIWHHTFYNELRVAPEEHPLFIIDSGVSPKENLEKTVQIGFETFNVPSICIRSQALLSSYGADISTGLVIDVGHEISQIVQIYENYPVISKTVSHIAGQTITEYIHKIILEENHNKNEIVLDQQNCEKIKEKLCYVSNNYWLECEKFKNSSLCDTFYLPDGKGVQIGLPLIRGPEVLFQPGLLGFNSIGLHLQAYRTICESDIELKKKLYSNIILSGNTTMLPGLSERLVNEINILAPNSTRIKVKPPKKRKHSAFFGGLILSALSTFSSMSTSLEEYDDIGPSIVHRKYFQMLLILLQ